jgi:hypothetical protein
MSFRNRIIGEGEESPADLLANPLNHRIHPKEQTDALAGALREVGWVQRVIVNQTTGHIIDGHARVKIALRQGDETIPVLYVDLDENEERVILAALDAITGLAIVDDDMLGEILNGIEVQDEALAAFLAGLLREQEEPDTGGAEARETLAERFLVPPFSVLDGRAGYWQDRKRAWMQLGIKSELGRGDDLTYGISCQPPHVHDRKKAIEAEIGETMGWNDFAERYPEEIKLAGTSIFDPVLTEVAYRWFAPEGGKVLDPFAGGSVRGVVAAMLGLEYTGIDLRAEQVEANRQNWQQITGPAAEVERVN